MICQPDDCILLVPLCFSSNIMLITAINTGNLFLPLWRGTFRAKTMDDRSMRSWAILMKATWKAHGSLITDTISFLLGSFDQTPLEPCRKDQQ
ncbi:hypothetical protein EDB19DRAFT_1633581 [Suillus lakei]|nr:hypothetical protein EDB19DRAFT_1633581 [Suillus lakei]